MKPFKLKSEQDTKKFAYKLAKSFKGGEILALQGDLGAGKTTLTRYIGEYFGDMLFDTVIHKTVKLAEAPSYGEPVLSYAPRSKGSIEYKTLAEEICNGKA